MKIDKNEFGCVQFKQDFISINDLSCAMTHEDWRKFDKWYKEKRKKLIAKPKKQKTSKAMKSAKNIHDDLVAIGVNKKIGEVEPSILSGPLPETTETSFKQ